MEWLKRQTPETWLLKGFIVFSLLFPAFYSPYTDVYQSVLYGGFSWAYLMLVLYIALQIWKGIKLKKKMSIPCICYIAAIVIYNGLSLYFNYKYLHWYWEQNNNTVAFLCLAALIGGNMVLKQESDGVIRFLIHCIVISNAASIIYRLLGYTKLMICNNQFVFFEGSYKEFRHYWIYGHKSEYALMLVAFVALFLVYQDKFRNRITFALSTAVLLVCLAMTHSWTGIVGCMLVFTGALLDRLDWKKILKKKSFWIACGVFLLLAAVMVYWIAAERNLTTLNGRTHIWKAALGVIREYPQGWGMRFGESMFMATETWMVNNAHNLFLNAVLRFSIPVGICFTVLFLAVVVYSIYKSKRFLVAGMWAALLMLLMMDYALMSLQMAMLFFVVYLVSFRGRQNVTAK